MPSGAATAALPSLAEEDRVHRIRTGVAVALLALVGPAAASAADPGAGAGSAAGPGRWALRAGSSFDPGTPRPLPPDQVGQPGAPANALAAPPGEHPALRPLTLSGSVTPPLADQRVVLERRTAEGWRTLATTSTGAHGGYRFELVPDRPGTWTVRTTGTDPATGAALHSATRTFTVLARLDAVVTSVARGDVPYSYRSGCPVGPKDLRRLALTHWGLDGALHRGELILHRTVVDDMTRVFGSALAARFPIQQMVRVDRYQGDDPTSMRAGNTSAFNCRKVVGNPYRMSRHSWGDAIDINPWQNPYVDTSGRVYPNRRYLDRSLREPGMHYASGPVPTAMRREGWPWGARWRHKDYHHFSRTGA